MQIICSDCSQSKDAEEFHKNCTTTTGRQTICKVCSAFRSKQKRRTSSGLIANIYNNERQASKRRGHPLPAYTEKELTAWLYAQGFKQLYIAWVNSGYQKELSPSVDRLDSNHPYTLNNLRLVTWDENNDAYRKERMACKHVTRNSRSVHQITRTGLQVATFKTIAAAARQTGISPHSISEICSGKTKRRIAGGFQWKYAS